MKRKLLLIVLACFSLVALAKVNINTANLDELRALKGIGEKRAQLIIEYREEYGKFSTIEDLKKVKGIGEKTFQDIKDDIKLTGETDLSQL